MPPHINTNITARDLLLPAQQAVHPLEDSLGTDSSSTSPSYLVISGGTGCNAICTAFARACYVLPVSDDGGSSSEIIRVLGGPSIGDIRSRLVRLIPPAPPGTPLDTLRTLLAHRLPSGVDAEQAAREEWRTIVEGRSTLWVGIPEDRKETIRGFLVFFESEILRRAHKNFSFVNGSIGNFLLAAAQAFFRSLPSAIFLFSSITNSHANIVPVITTNHTVTIAAELMDETQLVGQCEISHPVARSPSYEDEFMSSFSFDTISPTVNSQTKNVHFDAEGKDSYERLRAPISRLYYINSYGHEIHPVPTPEYISGLGSNEVLVYSCGSLWTSIIPCLALRGVASAIAHSRSLRAKVLFLNSKNDRETEGYTAVDYIRAIARTLNARYLTEPYGLAPGNSATTYPASVFVTHLVHLRGCTVHVDVARVMLIAPRESQDFGVECIEVESDAIGRDGIPLYNVACAQRAMKEVLGRK
ncbi:UPF0052-domain-containing protein [Multifurca ochricompacta]|uniref:UPF0052-domain-containing protein n=1 Tax=Multifurca ochricompacta TaxID=376703 RepID=A0AAD4LY36_9AGAM|nr:UPF0052-domain-containing protein [Multifurca ochricompacta]